MKSCAISAIVALVVSGLAVGNLPAQSQTSPPPPAAASQPTPTPEQAAIYKKVEAYLRKTYAWGPDFSLKVGPLSPAPAGELYTVPVQVTIQGQTDSTDVYVSKDGNHMFRGDIVDLNANPFADTLSQLSLNGAASKGPANAVVTLVEFGDFECPSCRELDSLLRQVLPKYPQVRLVFKDFPLEQIHPWARTAAIAGRCALHQNQDIFWKFHDAVYDSQDLISPENSYNKLIDIAVSAGADKNAFQTCMADQKTADEVDATEAEGRLLQINSTPTTFVNGRRLIGPDQTLLDQYIQFDSKP